MPEVFISYRREDSSGHAGRIFDCMRERFGDESVFMDVTDIEPGVDFTQALDTALSACRVVLVVIGSQWLTSTDPAGRRRLDDPADHLRLEIVGALARDAHVIPVLVRGALMPREQDLPGDLQPLARRQAHEISDSRWAFDTDQLLAIVERDLGAGRRGDPPAPATQAISGVTRPPRRYWIRILVPAAVLVALFGLVFAFQASMVDESSGGFRPPPASASRPVTSGAGGPAPSQAPSPAAPRREPLGGLPARLPASGEVRAGSARYKVLGGLMNVEPGRPQTVRFLVRITNVAAANGFIVSLDSFRLVVDGEAMPPTEGPLLALSMQSAHEGWVVFRAPVDAGAVLLQVGDFRKETATIPIDLRLAGADVSDKPAPAWRSPVEVAARFEKPVGGLSFKLDGVRLEHFADAVPPQPEKLEVTFKMSVENLNHRNGAVVGADLFRLLVDGVPLAPTRAPIELLVWQASLDTDVVFVMPGTAVSVILQIGNLNAQTAKMPIDLSAAH